MEALNCREEFIQRGDLGGLLGEEELAFLFQLHVGLSGQPGFLM